MESAVAGSLHRVTGVRRLLGFVVLFCGLAWVVAALVVLYPADLGFDFKLSYEAAEGILSGDNPYPESLDRASVEQAYAYPPPVAFLAVPFTAVSSSVASVVAAALTAAGVLAILLLLGVRDPRVYGVVLLWAPVFNAVQLVNATMVVTLLVALAWRWRDSSLGLAIALGLAVAVKAVIAPIVLWPLVTRRAGSAVLATAIAVVVGVGSWGVIGFDGFTGYPALAEAVAESKEEQSYSLSGTLRRFGLPGDLTRLAMIAVAVPVVWLAVIAGRRGDDFRAFLLPILAALVLAPVVWLHYLTLLIVPLAIARPRLGALWFLPLILWLTPTSGDPRVAESVAVSAVTVTIAVVLLVRPRTESSLVRSTPSPALRARG